MKIIAKINSPFKTKFGIPRQSGIAETEARIVFEPEFRNNEALRGIEGFSHLWLIWEFSEAKRDSWSPTVRPPRLGGNKRIGVFATRSPFRPNPIGLSSVKLLGIENDDEYGKVIVVSGGDLMDGTPIYDIKPYIAYTDCHTDAKGGFTDNNSGYTLEVKIADEKIKEVPENLRASLVEVLKNDPRPRYQNDENRVYGFRFSDLEIKFSVKDETLSVESVKKTN